VYVHVYVICVCVCACVLCARDQERKQDREEGGPMHMYATIAVLVAIVAVCCSVLQCSSIRTRHQGRGCPFLPFPYAQRHNSHCASSHGCRVLQCFAMRNDLHETDRQEVPPSSDSPYTRHKSHRASSKCCSVCAKRDREEAATLIFRSPMHKAIQRPRTTSTAARQVSNAHERDSYDYLATDELLTKTQQPLC